MDKKEYYEIKIIVDKKQLDDYKKEKYTAGDCASNYFLRREIDVLEYNDKVVLRYGVKMFRKRYHKKWVDKSNKFKFDNNILKKILYLLDKEFRYDFTDERFYPVKHYTAWGFNLGRQNICLWRVNKSNGNHSFGLDLPVLFGRIFRRLFMVVFMLNIVLPTFTEGKVLWFVSTLVIISYFVDLGIIKY